MQRSKIRDYILNPKSPDGRHKARVFRSVLGYERADAERLVADIKAAVLVGTPTGWRLHPDGAARWTVVFPLTGPNGRTHTVTSGWRVVCIGNAPRLLTAYVNVSR